MNNQIMVIILAYFLVISPSCNTTGENSSKVAGSNKDKKSTSVKLSAGDKKSLEEAKEYIFSLFEDSEIEARTKSGEVVSKEYFLDSMKNNESDVYLIDKSSDESKKFMIGLKMTALQDKSKKSENYIEIAANLWSVKPDKSRGDFISSSKRTAKVTNNKTSTITNLKSAMNEVIFDLNPDPSSGGNKLIGKVVNVLIVTLIVAGVASMVLGSGGYGGILAVFLFGGGIVSVAAGSLIWLCKTLVKRSKERSRKNRLKQMIPMYDLQ